MGGFTFNKRHASPFYSGGAVVNQQTLDSFDVALGGHPYMIDWKAEQPLSYAPVPFTRAQSDTSDSPGEHTINPEGFWRRSGDSWHVGAGQTDYDRNDSDPFRFDTSLGMNIWNKWELSLLPQADYVYESSATNQKMAVAGSRLYYTDGAALKYVSSVSGLETSLRSEGGLLDHASTADAANFTPSNLTDVLRVEIRCTADDWTPTFTTGPVVAGQAGAGAIDTSWFLGFAATGEAVLFFSDDGSTLDTEASTAATGFTDGTEHWVAFEFVGDNGGGNYQVDFETSADGSSWSALGSSVVGSGTYLMHNSVADFVTGAVFGWKGYVKEMRLYMNAVMQANPIFSDQIVGTTQFDDDQDNTWILTGSGVSIVNDGVTPTTVTGTPGGNILDIVSDGFHVWTAHGASGIYRTDNTSATTASHITGTVEILGYTRNRVMAANNNSIYDVTSLAMGSSGALPTALFTHANSDFQWVAFADLDGFIYMAGYSGDKTLLYRTSVKADGTALDVPTVAGHLPDSEIVTHINGYLGNYLFIGSTKGYRLALNSDGGDLNIGKRINTPNPVYCSEGQEEFIYYGLSDFMSNYTGLGRLSTGQFSDLDGLVPAYASDLMANPYTGTVSSVVTFNDKRVFAVNGVGVFLESNAFVSSGYLDTGKISFNMTEAKIGVWLNIQHEAGSAGFNIYASSDDGPFVLIGSHGATSTSTTYRYSMGNVSAANTEFRIELLRGPTMPNISLTFKSWIFEAQPTAEPTDYIYATLIFADFVENRYGQTKTMDTNSELNYLSALRRNRTVVTWQVGKPSYTVILEDFNHMYKSLIREGEGHSGHNASCLVKMKVIL